MKSRIRTIYRRIDVGSRTVHVDGIRSGGIRDLAVLDNRLDDADRQFSDVAPPPASGAVGPGSDTALRLDLGAGDPPDRLQQILRDAAARDGG